MSDGTRAQKFEVEIKNLVNSNHNEFLDFTASVNDNLNKMSDQIQQLFTEIRNGRGSKVPEEQTPMQRSPALERGLSRGVLGPASSSGQTSSLGRVQQPHQGIFCTEIQSSTAKMDGKRIHNERDDCVEIDDKDNLWGDANERIFIELMVEEVKKGNLGLATSTFSKTASRNIARSLKEKVGMELTHNQLKNKYHNLRARQRKFKALIKEPGIGYNPQTGEVSASEDVWETLKKVHSLARRFRRQGCKEYKELCFIFGDTTVIGYHQPTSTKLPSDSEDESHDLEDSEDNVTEPDGIGKNKAKVITPKKKKVKRAYSHVFENALPIGEHSKRKNDLLEQKMQESSVRESMPEQPNRENQDVNAMIYCLRALDILDLGGVAYGKAVKALHDSSLYREIFLHMSDERKKDWVLAL